MVFNIRTWAAGLVFVLLTACGGGGGGGGGSSNSAPPLTATISPASVVLTGNTTSYGQPSARVSVLLAGTLNANVEAVVIGSAKGLVSGIVDATGTVVVFGNIPARWPQVPTPTR